MQTSYAHLILRLALAEHKYHSIYSTQHAQHMNVRKPTMGKTCAPRQTPYLSPCGCRAQVPFNSLKRSRTTRTSDNHEWRELTMGKTVICMRASPDTLSFASTSTFQFIQTSTHNTHSTSTDIHACKGTYYGKDCYLHAHLARHLILRLALA